MFVFATATPRCAANDHCFCLIVYISLVRAVPIGEAWHRQTGRQGHNLSENKKEQSIPVIMADDNKPTSCVPCGGPITSEADDNNACSRPRLGRKLSSRRKRRGSAAEEYLLQRGDVAPNFQLQAVDGSTMQLSDFRGKKVMVCLYRHPFCPICAYTVNNLIGHYKKVRAFI